MHNYGMRKRPESNPFISGVNSGKYNLYIFFLPEIVSKIFSSTHFKPSFFAWENLPLAFDNLVLFNKAFSYVSQI